MATIHRITVIPTEAGKFVLAGVIRKKDASRLRARNDNGEIAAVSYRFSNGTQCCG